MTALMLLKIEEPLTSSMKMKEFILNHWKNLKKQNDPTLFQRDADPEARPPLVRRRLEPGQVLEPERPEQEEAAKHQPRQKEKQELRLVTMHQLFSARIPDTGLYDGSYRRILRSKTKSYATRQHFSLCSAGFKDLLDI